MSRSPTYSRAVTPATGNLLNLVALVFHLLPKNLISFVTGAVARLSWPRPVGTMLCRSFAALFKLNMAEAALPITAFSTVEDVFTRALRPGVRPVAGPVCSPADGYLAHSTAAAAGQAVQAKGLTYELAELVRGHAATSSDSKTNALDLAWYQTIYLAPHNYHRVHAPFSGRVVALRYLPGQLWPVNVPFVLRIPRLFTRNERLVFDFELETGGRAYVVMVGAFNVGRMTTPLVPDLVSNALDRQLGLRPRLVAFDPPRSITIGDEIGTFMLGSTVIIAYDRQAIERLQLVQGGDNRPLLMGQTLCARQT